MDLFLTTLGCRLNEAEINTWSRDLTEQTHRVVASPERADVIVVNTCAVTHEATRKSKKLVSGLHRKNPLAKIVVTGCFATLDAQKSAALNGVDLVVANSDKDQLVQIIQDNIDIADMPARATSPESSNFEWDEGTPDKVRAFVKVQDGCRNKCSFCIVTSLRGDEKSRTIESVVDEIKFLGALGHKEVVLTGVHLGGYGCDLGTNLSSLVRAILKETRIPRVRLSSLEPWDLPKDFADLWQNKRLMPHLHLPLQSGCDATLKRMARRCLVKQYRGLVDTLRASVDDLMITTDLIVGFPGESDSEWQESLATAKAIGFSHMHIFSYSAREGTKAATLSGRIPGPLMKERSRAMHELAATMKADALRATVGQSRNVLWESSKTQGDGSKTVYGYTDNYLRVAATSSADAPVEDTITCSMFESYDAMGQLICKAI